MRGPLRRSARAGTLPAARASAGRGRRLLAVGCPVVGGRPLEFVGAPARAAAAAHAPSIVADGGLPPPTSSPPRARAGGARRRSADRRGPPTRSPAPAPRA